MTDKDKDQDKNKQEHKKQEELKKHEEHKTHEAKTQPAMSTYNATNTTRNIPLDDPRGDTFLTHDEIKNLAGDIGPGELAHLALDEEGNPTGRAFRGIPDPDSVTATVIGTPTVKLDEIVTPSGAPVTKFMNPDPKIWDEGMLARNPRPTDKVQGPVGGGVVNQPVRV